MDELLKILQTNALETRENIARMLGVPAAEIDQRIDNYEKQGVIRGYQAILNEDRLDLDNVTAVIEVKVTPQREGGFDNIAQRISRFPEVKSAYLMSGQARSEYEHSIPPVEALRYSITFRTLRKR